MDVARVAQILLVVVLVCAALVKTYDATRGAILEPAARSLARWLAAAFWLLAVGNGLSVPSLMSGIDAVTAQGVDKVVFNAATFLGLAALLVFFYLSAAETPNQAHVSVRTTLAVAVAVSAAEAVLMFFTPPGSRESSVLSPGGGQAVVLAFYAVGGLWFIWGYTRAGMFATRFVRLSSGALAAASTLIATGLLLFALTSVARLIITFVSAFSGTSSTLSAANTINFSASSVGQTLPAVGLCVLGALRIVDHGRRRRLYRALQPLWSRLRGSFPEVGLPAAPDTRALSDASANPGRTDRAGRGYERCLVEIWDGLMRLSSPLNKAVAVREPTTVTAVEIAAAIAEATATVPPTGADEPTAASPELLEVLTAGEPDHGLETGVRFLAAVSQALERAATPSRS